MNEQISNAFQAAMSPDAGQRQQAEKFLDSLGSQAGFSIAVLQVIQANCADPTKKPLRQIAAVYFKNTVKKVAAR